MPGASKAGDLRRKFGEVERRGLGVGCQSGFTKKLFFFIPHRNSRGSQTSSSIICDFLIGKQKMAQPFGNNYHDNYFNTIYINPTIAD